MTELTRIGMLRRQRPLAMQALARYGIRCRRVDLVSQDTNFIYRVTSEDGTRYALRLVAPLWRTEDNLRAEVTWLEALSRDTDIPVPVVIPTLGGEPFVRLAAEEGGPERRALLMTWLPGMLLGHRLNTMNIRKMGTLFGSLHRHASDWDLPKDFPDARFTGFLGRGEENLLFSDEFLRQCSSEDVEVLQTARGRVEQAYGEVPESDLGVIHCDLWHDNIKIYKGELAPFDFEDTILGYRIHDIAMAMLDLAETVGTDEYDPLLAAFRLGYESVLPFPDGDMLSFQLGRMLWMLNWVARFHPAYFGRAVVFRASVLRRALAVGRLVDPLSP